MVPDHDISFRIQQLAKLLAQSSDQALVRQLGIGMAQLRILMAIGPNQRLTQQRIGLALDQTEAAVSRQMKILQKRDLVTARPNPKDRRQHLASLTFKGRKTLGSSLMVLQDLQRPYLVSLSEKQQDMLMTAIDKLEYMVRSSLAF